MDLIREQLIYKDVPVKICMKKISEHYELTRILLATRTKDVSICCSEKSNVFIQILLKKLGVQLLTGCSETDSVVGSST